MSGRGATCGELTLVLITHAGMHVNLQDCVLADSCAPADLLRVEAPTV